MTPFHEEKHLKLADIAICLTPPPSITSLTHCARVRFARVGYDGVLFLLARNQVREQRKINFENIFVLPNLNGLGVVAGVLLSKFPK